MEKALDVESLGKRPWLWIELKACGAHGHADLIPRSRSHQQLLLLVDTSRH